MPEISLEMTEDQFCSMESPNAKLLKLSQMEILKRIFNNQVVTPKEKEQFLDGIRSLLGCKIFISILPPVPKNNYILSNENFQTLGSAFCTLLTSETEFKPDIAIIIIKFGRAIYSVIGDNKVYLYKIISKHIVWKDPNNGKKIIDHEMKSKIEKEKRKKKGIKEQNLYSGLFDTLKLAIEAGLSFFGNLNEEENFVEE